MHDAQLDTPDTSTPTPAAPVDDVALAQRLNALLVRAAVANLNAARAKKSADEAKAAVTKVLRRGGSQSAANPVKPGEEIAQVTVSKLTYNGEVVDRSATEEWVKVKYSDRVESKVRVIPGCEQAVMEAIRQFAPYLLEEIQVVPDHVIRELVLKSEEAQQPMGWGGEIDDDAPPGIKVTESTPKVTITYRRLETVDSLILDGVVDVDGNLLGGAL